MVGYIPNLTLMQHLDLQRRGVVDLQLHHGIINYIDHLSIWTKEIRAKFSQVDSPNLIAFALLIGLPDKMFGQCKDKLDLINMSLFTQVNPLLDEINQSQ
eukprot:15226111-Ditylum_brightwellii.AAC.1